MLISSKRLWLDRWQTARCYYRKRLKFAWIDLTFGLIGLFVNPYRTCRKFLQKRGEKEIYVYGETPFATYERIVKECGIGPQDTWMEMGAGRGKGCFWLACFVGCRVIGVEWIFPFVAIAKVLKAIFRMKNVQFECRNIQQVDLSRATAIYFYGHQPRMEIPPHVKVIAISEPLEGFPILKSFWVRYPWGRTTAFLQMK